MCLDSFILGTYLDLFGSKGKMIPSVCMLNSQRVHDVGLRGECWECGDEVLYIQMDASIIVYMMYCIMLLVLVLQDGTTRWCYEVVL